MLAAGAAGADQLKRTRRELARPRSLQTTAYVGSQQCKHCHPSHYASFARTFHSRMTQEATADNVLGSFGDGSSSRFQYLGITAQMQKLPNDEYWMTFEPTGVQAPKLRVRVERCVGSHRYQQYLARDADIFFRLPIAWDVQRQQFFHMNGAFLTPDPALSPAGTVSNIDYNRHVTRWNDNCVYCHNVHPNPGLDLATGRFDTQVAELGVACEACHGPGAEHVSRNADPLRRYALHSSGGEDPSIRNPSRMPALRSAEVCGRCHGQRIASNIERFHQGGDPFVPGQPLSQYSKPLERETLQNGEPGLFRARFWPDGSARLTAYEFQGYLQSPCRADETFSCESCHAMHEGDPAGQLRPDRAGNASCTGCHRGLGSPLQAAAHAQHPVGSSGTECRSCHMPDIVYGLVSVHLSHRIESPRLDVPDASSRPDACTLCHVDRTRTWAAKARSHDHVPDDPAARFGVSEMAYRVFAGDPIERAVAAHALGNPAASYAPQYRGVIIGLLLESAQSDSYPAVRSIARAALSRMLAQRDVAQPTAQPSLASFVPTASAADRRVVLDAVRASLRPQAIQPPPADLVAALRARAQSVDIEIGE